MFQSCRGAHCDRRVRGSVGLLWNTALGFTPTGLGLARVPEPQTFAIRDKHTRYVHSDTRCINYTRPQHSSPNTEIIFILG